MKAQELAKKLFKYRPYQLYAYDNRLEVMGEIGHNYQGSVVLPHNMAEIVLKYRLNIIELSELNSEVVTAKFKAHYQDFKDWHNAKSSANR